MTPEEDEIIGEMPVFLSQDLAQNLYLLQYPLRPAARPYSANLGEVSSVRVKPMQKLMEVEYDLATSSPNYDANNTTEGVDQKPVTKLKLSSKSVPPKTNYTAGVVIDGALHLTPLRAVCRMLPDLTYIDQAEEDAKVADKKHFEKTEKKEEKEEASMTPLLVKFQTKKRNVQTSQNVTHAYLKATQEREPYVDLEPHPAGSQQALAQLDRMLCATTQHNVQFDVEASGYLRYINTPNAGAGPAAAAAAAAASGKGVLPTNLAVRSILRSAHAVPFGVLCGALARQRFGAHAQGVDSQAGRDMVREALVECQKQAHLVKGNWVVKSTGLFVGRDKVCRDYVITQLRKKAPLDRARIQDVLKWDYQTSQRILQDIARPLGDEHRGKGEGGEGRVGQPVGRSQGVVVEQGGGEEVIRKCNGLWEFKLPRDEKFMKTFAKVTAAQHKILDKMEARLTSELAKGAGSAKKKGK